MQLDFSNRKVLVTGSTRGLGRAMAFGFAQAGADIVVSSRNQDACDETAAEIEKLGVKALPLACHVGRWDAIDAFVDEVYSRWERIDVLVNNAGMSPLYPSLVDVSEELFDKVMAVNLKGPFRLSALIGTRMAGGEGGAIVNISSDAAKAPSAAYAPYGAAKAGLNNLTGALAHAFGPSVRVNTIGAGNFRTDISKAWDMDAVNDWSQEHVCLKRVGEPEEIVGAALYLASDAASYTTGAVFDVTGGIR